MNRLDLVKTKYPDHFEAAVAIGDPTKTNKYLLWIATQLSKGYTAADIKGTVDFFHKFNSKFKERDIYQYSDLKALEDLCKAMPEKSKRKEREDLKEYGSEVIADTDIFKVIRVDTKASMILYGANTKWCTVSKDSTYYEEYVARGSDFYITVFKGKSPLASDKYAIVRTNLLSFEVFAANDINMRSFKPKEQEVLHDVIAAVAADKPKDNMLRVILNNKKQLKNIKGLDEWLAVQLPSTLKYLGKTIPDFEDLSLKNIGNNGQALVDFLISAGVPKLKKLNTTQLKAVAEFLETWSTQAPGIVDWETKKKIRRSKDGLRMGVYSIKNLINIYDGVGKYFSQPFLHKLASNPDYKIRCIFAAHINDTNEISKMLVDKSKTVSDIAIKRLTSQQLLDILDSDVSKDIKKVISANLETLISTKDLYDFILKKPHEELLNILIRDMITKLLNTNEGKSFLFSNLSVDEKKSILKSSKQ